MYRYTIHSTGIYACIYHECLYCICCQKLVSFAIDKYFYHSLLSGLFLPFTPYHFILSGLSYNKINRLFPIYLWSENAMWCYYERTLIIVINEQKKLTIVMAFNLTWQAFSTIWNLTKDTSSIAIKMLLLDLAEGPTGTASEARPRILHGAPRAASKSSEEVG